MLLHFRTLLHLGLLDMALLGLFMLCFSFVF